MATTVSHRLSPTQAHAIADLTGYEDADTLRWQQACVQAAQQLTAERGRYAGTDTDQLAHGLDLAQRGCVTLAEALDDLRAEVTSGTAHYTVDLAEPGCPCLDFRQRKVPCTHLLAAEMHTGALGLFTASEPLIPPDTAPRVPNTSLQEGPGSRSGPSSRQEEPGATASGPARARRTRTVRAPRGQAPAPTGSAASWPTSEAPASMNVKLKVGNMELMYTARDTNDRDLQDRMTTLLPWLAEVMAACEANAEARQQTAKQAAAQPTPPPPPAPEPERTLDEQVAATVQAAMPAQATASPTGAGPAADGRRTPPPPPASERTNDMDPRWCVIHTCAMEQHSNARGTWWSHYLGTDAHGTRRYCKGE
jgi:hypothetical protein